MKKWVLITSVIVNFVLVATLVFGFFYHRESNIQDEKYMLDASYNQEIEEAESNFEKGEINDKYSDLWFDKITLYNDALICYYSQNEKMQNEINLSHDEWLKYKEIQEDVYFDFLLSVYTTGSIVPLLQNEKRCELTRDRAIFLYKQCEMLSLDVDMP